MANVDLGSRKLGVWKVSEAGRVGKRYYVVHRMHPTKEAAVQHAKMLNLMDSDNRPAATPEPETR